MQTDINNLMKISYAIKKITREYGVDYENASLEVCQSILHNSQVLNEILKKYIVDGIKEKDLYSIKDKFCLDLISLYIEENNIEIISEDFVSDNERDMKLDAYSLYLRDISRFTIPTYEEELELFKRINSGDLKAREEIINRNQRLVRYIATSHANNQEELLNLIQEGNIGLLKAIENFDYTKGFKFSTYATYWINQAINRGKNNEKQIKVPEYMSLRRKKIISDFVDVFNREPSLEEQAEMLHIPLNDMYNYEVSTMSPTSLYTPINDEEDAFLEDTIADPTYLTPESTAISKVLREEALKFFRRRLTEKEYEALVRFYGFTNDGIPQKKGEIAQELNVSNERVGQLVRKAQKKLAIDTDKILSFTI